MSLHKHRSRIITDGLARAPQRAFLRATGLDDTDMAKSFVGIVTTAGENTPCSMSLLPQADQARLGVAAGGGVPVSFTTVSVSDGTSMNHAGMRMSLLSRELIADSVELVVRAHGYDALVAFGGCDKTLPGLMMALVRLSLHGASLNLDGHRLINLRVTYADLFKAADWRSTFGVLRLRAVTEPLNPTS
jgi:dihydroxy-acid dehydratase